MNFSQQRRGYDKGQVEEYIKILTDKYESTILAKG